MFFVLSLAWDKKKIPSSHKESNLRPSDSALYFRVLPLSHRDSTVSEVYYEGYITLVLHTSTIRNV